MSVIKNPPREVIEAARHNPGGWVYQVDAKYSTEKNVPPEAIVGAWEVDLSGNVVGQFLPNPNYRPKLDEQQDSELSN
jgi:hypothetical protein